jgi:nucleotide-binding universal stress UspA family protein
MKQFDNVLVALDPTSRDGESALEFGAEAASLGGGRLTLLVALEGPTSQALHEYADSEGISLTQAADTYLDQVESRVVPDIGSIDKVAVSGSDLAQEILEYAKEAEVSTIVVTSRGREDRALINTVTSGAQVPVLVVPSR